jgi:putative transposase
MKNKRIAKTRRETITRHKKMVCKAYELKVDKSHLNQETQEQLRLLFLEAKWFYNDMLARGDVWNADYKRTEVLVRNKDKVFETRKLENFSSQMRQGIVYRARYSIVSLSRLRKNGHRVGALKFKSRIASIPLIQYGVTYRVKGEKYVHVQNMKQPLKVRGLAQVPKEAELTSATLEQRGRDYFVHVTTFQRKVRKKFPMNALGVDFGIDKQLTLSNGLDVREGVIRRRESGAFIGNFQGESGRERTIERSC